MTRRRTLILVVLVLLLALTGLVVVVRQFVQLPRRAAQSLAEKALARKEEQIDLSFLVTRIQEMSRLQTASMRVMHVSTIRQSRGVIPDAFAGDELTFLAVGDVIGGVDLSQLRREHVRMEPDGTLVLQLPPSKILVSRIDNDASRVVSRKTGMMRRSDVHLESRARAYAEQAVRREALGKGILRISDENAEKKLAEFLLTLGVKQVRFERVGAPTTRG